MSIWQKAYETYENHAHLVGLASVKQTLPLTPVGHMVMNAQLEITITSEGVCVGVVSVTKEKCKTIIPATEESSNRVGDNTNAHPLCDQLRYLCREGGAKYDAYLKQLRAWDASEFSHPKVQAVLKYIEGDTILSDLATWGYDKDKIEGTERMKCLVRWRVIDAPSGSKSAVWEDISLFEAFSKYRASAQREKSMAICFITGEDDIVVKMHPKGVVASANGAKLISANDSSGFTYRGRFLDGEQAATVGYTASQKAHNALQWVATNQGYVQGGRTFVCWNPKGKPVHRCFDPFEDGEEVSVEPSDYYARLKRTLGGYRNDLPENEDVVIAAFDAATTGRLSVTYYSELRASDYYDRIENWYRTCCFSHNKFGIHSPTLYRIVTAAFGTERNKYLDIDEKLLREQMQRMLSCVIDKAQIPFDIVKALRNRASQPLAYKSKDVRNTVTFAACAVIRKYLNDLQKKEEWTMVLDTEKRDRSYLFGRLLAVMEYAERSTYGNDEGREPNAIRLQAVFTERPMSTARIINDSLTPYLQKMSPGKRAYMKNMIQSIIVLLEEEDVLRLNQRLDDTYLLGYYLQRNSLYTKKNKTEDDENE